MYQNKNVPPRTIAANNLVLSPDHYQCACRVLQSKSFCFAPGHQWKWYRLIKSELPWFLLCIAPLIPCFGNMVEGGGVPKFLLNTVRWWLKPLYTFCTGHIFEKSSLWNCISLTWGSLGRSLHSTAIWIWKNLSEFVILLNFWDCVMHVHTFCFGYGKLNWVSPLLYGIFSARISVHFNSQTMKWISLLFKLT